MMINMIINTEILDRYLSENSLDGVKEHWIFNSIVEGQHLIEEPNNFNRNKLKEIYEMLISKLNNFEPLNKCLWHEFYGNINIPDTISVYLIVGSPKPYDAMVRKDDKWNNCIILDLFRIGSYSEDISKLSGIVSNFVTHEVSHVLTGGVYTPPTIKDSVSDKLKYIVFDEGIAHFLSNKDDILSIDWYSDEMNTRRKNAYEALCDALKNISDTNKNQILERANSGLYWEKFGAISGFFGIIDYYNYNGKDIKVFKEIFEKGPKSLINFILDI